MPDIHGLAGRSGLLSKAIDSTVHSPCFSQRGLALFIMVTVACSLLAVRWIVRRSENSIWTLMIIFRVKINVAIYIIMIFIRE